MKYYERSPQGSGVKESPESGSDTPRRIVQEAVLGSLNREKTPTEKILLYIAGDSTKDFPKIMKLLRRPGIENQLDETILKALSDSMGVLLFGDANDRGKRAEALALIGEVIAKRRELSLIGINTSIS